MKLYKSAHSVYKTQYHIVWISRYRRKILQKGIDEYFKELLAEVCKHFPDFVFEAVGTDIDHVHIQMVIPPKYSVSKVIGILKSNTSRKMRERFADLRRVYWDGRGIWGAGFFVIA